MVQTASTSEADQSHVPGATTIRAVGTLLILLGGYRLYAMATAAVELVQEGLFPDLAGVFVVLFLGGALALLTIVAGVRLVRLNRVGRAFGLVVCSVVLALQVLSFGLKVVALNFSLAPQAQSPGLLFWLLQPLSIVVFVVVIILIARWHPPREIEQLGRIFD